MGNTDEAARRYDRDAPSRDFFNFTIVQRDEHVGRARPEAIAGRAEIEEPRHLTKISRAGRLTRVRVDFEERRGADPSRPIGSPSWRR